VSGCHANNTIWKRQSGTIGFIAQENLSAVQILDDAENKRIETSFEKMREGMHFVNARKNLVWATTIAIRQIAKMVRDSIYIERHH